jgi:Uma2 family endonuclease
MSDLSTNELRQKEKAGTRRKSDPSKPAAAVNTSRALADRLDDVTRIIPGTDLALVLADGVPLEAQYHVLQINLLQHLTHEVMVARNRSDYFSGGNMFIYYSLEQAQLIATNPPSKYRKFTGPDYFFVDHVPHRDRPIWVAWEEDERYPDVIVELLSPATQAIDRGIKKQRYQDVFKTPEYYLYKPGSDRFKAFHLREGKYCPAERDAGGRVWSSRFGAWLGLWGGDYLGSTCTWLRLFESSFESSGEPSGERAGRLIPTSFERAQAADAQAQAAEERAQTAGAQAQAAEERARAAEERARAAERERELLMAVLERIRVDVGDPSPEG